MRFLLPCPRCLGKGGTIPSLLFERPSTPCGDCGGTGEIAKSAAELTPIEAEQLRAALAPIPPDPDLEYARESTKEHIITMLQQRWTEVVVIPGLDPVCIDLVNRRGTIYRIKPEFRQGKFHNLTVEAQVQAHIFPPEEEETNDQTPT